MNTKTCIFYLCLLTTQFVFPSNPNEFTLTKSTEKKWSNTNLPPSRIPSPLGSKDRMCRMYKLINAQIQALRNSTIVDHPNLFANQEYKTLEVLVFHQASRIGILYKKHNYLINFNNNKYHSPSGDIHKDIAQCYGKYSDDPDALPKHIKNHKKYAEYNNDNDKDDNEDNFLLFSFLASAASAFSSID